jgi:hypothetical protein
MRKSVLVAAALILLAAASCTSSGSGPAPSGTISGTITYAGAAAGGGRPLSIAIYGHCPPKGPPLAFQLIETYTLPYRYQFDGLTAGAYCVGALIDVDPADTRYVGMLNPGRDPHGYAAHGHVVSVETWNGASSVDITLEDVP